MSWPPVGVAMWLRLDRADARASDGYDLSVILSHSPDLALDSLSHSLLAGDGDDVSNLGGCPVTV